MLKILKRILKAIAGSGLIVMGLGLGLTALPGIDRHLGSFIAGMIAVLLIASGFYLIKSAFPS